MPPVCYARAVSRVQKLEKYFNLLMTGIKRAMRERDFQQPVIKRYTRRKSNDSHVKINRVPHTHTLTYIHTNIHGYVYLARSIIKNSEEKRARSRILGNFDSNIGEWVAEEWKQRARIKQIHRLIKHVSRERTGLEISRSTGPPSCMNKASLRNLIAFSAQERVRHCYPIIGFRSTLLCLSRPRAQAAPPNSN